MPDLTKPPTLADILALWTDEDADEDNPLRDADARAALAAQMGDRLAAEVAARKVYELMPDATEAVGNNRPRAFAKALLAYLKEMGFGGDTPPAAVPSGPIEVTVRQDKSLEQMDFNELLEQLVADPNRYQEILPYLHATTTWRQITAKTQEWVLPHADGSGVDVQQTMHYVHQLLPAHANPQRMFNGRRPLPLEVALGVSVRPYEHPITGDPVVGLDQFGFDLDQLSDELHRAAIWARTSGHPLFPRNADTYTCMTELSSDPLPARWQQILDDFRHTLQVNDEVGRTVSRYWTRATAPVTQHPDDGPRAHLFGRPNPGDFPTMLLGDPASGLPGNPPGTRGLSAPEPVKDEAYYEQLVRGVASGPCNLNGLNAVIRKGVYTQLAVNASNTDARGAIILNGGSIQGLNAEGTLYVPYRVMISVDALNAEVEIIPSTWQKLAQLAGLA